MPHSGLLLSFAVGCTGGDGSSPPSVDGSAQTDAIGDPPLDASDVLGACGDVVCGPQQYCLDTCTCCGIPTDAAPSSTYECRDLPDECDPDDLCGCPGLPGGSGACDAESRTISLACP
jgi:hypothetical protein